MSKNIAVFFGGKSTEHDISIVTALSSVMKPLELSGKFNVIPVYITKSGVWYTDGAFKNISTFRDGALNDLLGKLKPVSVIFDGGMIIQTKSGLKKKNTKIDVAFPAMHGAYGEDGSIMGVFRMAGVPYVGCDMTSSVVAMDKVLSKQIIEAKGIRTPRFASFLRSDFLQDDFSGVLESVAKFSYPLFVKPAHLGSSIGITRVDREEDLANAIEVAFHFDEKILIEEAVSNLIEVTVPIMGNHNLTSALVERPLLSAEAFFDFDAKYMNGGKKGGAKKSGKSSQGAYSELPAQLPGDLYDEAVSVALNSYRALGCGGIARIDLLIDEKAKKVFFNEVNPLPGSLYAHNWRQAGVSGVDLVERLVALAEDRFEEEQKTEKVFATNFLQQF